MMITHPKMQDREIWLFRLLFVVAALWNLAGAVPGLFDSAGMFEREFGRELTDPVMLQIYKGAWGTTFLYFIGYLFVAYDPIRHTGVVILGGIGKALFALNVFTMYLNGWTTGFALLVVGGDAIFITLFLIYFVRLKRCGHRLV